MELQVTVGPELGFPMTRLAVQYTIGEGGIPVSGDMVRTLEPGSHKYIEDMMRHPRFRSSVDAALLGAFEKHKTEQDVQSRTKRQPRGQTEGGAE